METLLNPRNNSPIFTHEKIEVIYKYSIFQLMKIVWSANQFSYVKDIILKIFAIIQEKF